MADLAKGWQYTPHLDLEPTLTFLLLACAATGEDTDGGELPPIDTQETDDGDDSGTDTFRVDTSIEDTSFNADPKHYLTTRHVGSWEMSPNGGPWTDMTGELVVTEILDGDDLKPTCELRFALTGQAPEDGDGCPTCDATFDILHYVAEGDRSLCQDPELPQDGDVLRMGWSDQDDAVSLDYQGTGVWISWYPGSRIDDLVRFDWEATVGIVVPDEDG